MTFMQISAAITEKDVFGCILASQSVYQPLASSPLNAHIESLFNSVHSARDEYLCQISLKSLQ